MSTCAPDTPSLDICPTQDQILTQILALLPRGRAWSNTDGGPWAGQTLYNFWNAVAATRLYLEQRICALKLEFFCATRNETNDLWLEQYGLPDACEPYPDLCAKVAAHDGITCPDLVAAAARAGWVVACVEQSCGAQIGARAGRAAASSGVIAGAIVLLVDILDSPAYGGGAYAPPLAGLMRAGRRLTCPPDIDALKCLVARIAPADALVQFITVQSSFGSLDFSQSGNPLIGLL